MSAFHSPDMGDEASPVVAHAVRMLSSPRARATRRALAIGGFGLICLAPLAACGTGGGTASLPPGISAGGAVTVPDDVAVTPPPEENPTETPPAEGPVETLPAENPVDTPPAETAPAEGGGTDDTVAALDEVTSDDGVVWWPWALGLVAIGVVAMVVSRSRRGSSEWTARALTTMDASDALTMHLLAIPPESLVLVAHDDAERLTELDRTTQDLVRTTSDARTRGSIEGIRGPLVQLHAAVSMVSLTPAPTPDQLALVHQWANALHVATSTARSILGNPSP